MTPHTNLRSRFAAACALLALWLAFPAGAANYTVGEVAYKKLSEAQELLGAERYAEAAQVLDALETKRINPHERALLLQTRGFIQSSQERWAEAVASFEACLALEALPPGAQLGTLYNLAQLHMMREHYGKAAETLRTWFASAENPGPAAYYLLATAYALDSRYDEALRPAEQAVAGSDAPKEAWLQLLLTLYFEKRDYGKLASVLEQLVTRFPTKTYWMQLAAVYSELGRDRKSLAIQELAYEQGFLTEDTELRRLAQLYLFHELPYRAALVLERGLKEERVKSDPEAWEMLANSWIQAREYERSLAPLERAAALANTGDLYTRLGQIHLERREWSQAEKALTRALEHEKLAKRGNAWVLLGVSRYSADRFDEAEQAFNSARKFDASRETANRWLGHLERARATRALE